MSVLGVLGETQQGVVTFGGPVTRKNKPAEVQSLTYVSTDESVATFVAGVIDDATKTIVPDTANDGMIRGVVVAQQAGVCRVKLDADADMGDAVETISSEFVDIQVTAAKATGFGSPVFGSPVEQP